MIEKRDNYEKSMQIYYYLISQKGEEVVKMRK